MALPLLAAGLVLGGATLYMLYSLVSVIATWTAVLAGFAAFGGLLRYLESERPVQLVDSEVLNTLSYVAVSVPVGFAVYRLAENALNVLGWGIPLLVLVAVFLGFVFRPVTVVSGIVGAVNAVVDGLDG